MKTCPVLYARDQTAGLSSLGVQGVPWHPQILADLLTPSQPGGEDYAHHITTAPPPDNQTFLRPWTDGEDVHPEAAADRQTQTSEYYSSTQIITGHIFANYFTIIGKK